MEVPEHCIFRVPRRMREVKPEAYRPQIVVIGPLHRSLDATTNNGNPILYVKHIIHPTNIKKEIHLKN